MTVLGADTFIRANQSGFGTASDGQSWTATGSGTLSIASNKGVILSSGSDTHVRLGSQSIADMEVSCRVAIGNSGDVCGIQARFSAGSGTTTYKLVYYGAAIHINKSLSGSTTQMTNVSFTMTPGLFYWFRLRVVGTNLFGKIWADGSSEPTEWTTTTSDSSVTAPGGFAILASTAGPSTGVQFTSFLAVDSPTSQPIITTPVRAYGRDGRVIASGRDGRVIARGH